VNPEGGSPSCCAAALGSTNLTTAAPPTGTATTRPTSTPTTVFAPAVSSPQHPSPSEPLGGIPAGVHEGSRPAPVITGPAGESAQNPPTASSRQALLAWWAFHLAHSVNNCPTTSCTRPDAFGSLFGDGGHGRVMMSVRRIKGHLAETATYGYPENADISRSVLVAGYQANLDALKAHLDQGEDVLVSCYGAYDTKSLGSKTVKNGVLVATAKRVIQFGKRLSGFNLETFPLEKITAIEVSKGFLIRQKAPRSPRRSLR
jgi:hypothetical protein